MGEDQLLVDTDVLIAYLNRRAYRSYLESPRYRVYYSAITKKELLSKRGLKASERQAIFAFFDASVSFLSINDSLTNTRAFDLSTPRLPEVTPSSGRPRWRENYQC